MAAIEDFDRAAAAVGGVVDELDATELARPTPCEGWDVRALLNHVVFGNTMFTQVLAGGELAAPDERRRLASLDQLGGDPAGAYAASVERFRRAATDPGTVGATYATPVGPMTVDGVVRLRTNELLVHGWDLAHAVGRPADLPEELAADALVQWRSRLTDGARQPGGPFGPAQPVDDGAPASDRLAGFLGRQVS